ALAVSEAGAVVRAAAVVAGAANEQVLALVQGVNKAMALARMKVAALLGLAVAVVVVGVALATRPEAGAGPPPPADPAPAGGKEADGAVKAELKRLEGEWRIVAGEQGGRAFEPDDVVVFSGEKSTITNRTTKVVTENTFTIDPAREPKWMDVTNVKTGQTWP